MDRTKIEIIYKIIMKGMPLTFQTMLEHELDKEDIENFVNQTIIKQTEPNKYELSSIQGLYNYGVKLLLLRDPKNANKCFLKCFELDDLNRNFCLQLMLMQIKLGKISIAFKYFPHLEQTSEEKDIYDNTLYLYLFNLLTRCPEEYIEKLKNMDYDSYLLPTTLDIDFREEQNNIRQLIIKNKIKNALRLQNNLIAKKTKYCVSDEILKEFIIRLISLETKFKMQILDFSKAKDYNTIILFLETKSNKRFLTNEEYYARLICKKIIEISETHIVPSPTVENAKNLYDAIKGNNFSLALRLEKARLKRYEQNPDESINHILLSQINDLICQLEQISIEPPKTYIKL